MTSEPPSLTCAPELRGTRAPLDGAEASPESPWDHTGSAANGSTKATTSATARANPLQTPLADIIIELPFDVVVRWHSQGLHWALILSKNLLRTARKKP